MHVKLIDLVGFFGAFCTLLAFFNVSHGRWPAQSYRYQLTNLAAGVALIAYAGAKHALANVFLNTVWCVVALYGLYVASRFRGVIGTKRKKKT